MKKKILATILAFVSVACLAAGLTACTNDGTSGTGAQGEKGDGSNDNPQGLDFYLLDDGTYGVSVYKAYYFSDVVIPSTYNGKAVSTVLGDDLVSQGGLQYSNIKSVVVSEGITTIGDYAFYLCTSLESVTIPDSVTKIGSAAFGNCPSLASITIPDSVTTIGNSVFKDCPSLVYNEYGNAYYLGNQLNPYMVLIKTKTNDISSCSINDKTVFISSGAFYCCSSLESVTIPDGVTSIGNSAFYYCTSLESVTIPDSVTTIGNYAFSRCTSLASITIPDSVTTISDYAFSRCTSLASITIPDSVTTIGYAAFNNCTSLASITIPDSITTIGDNAFYYCTLLESVYYKGTSEQWGGVNIYSYNEALTNAAIYYYSATEPVSAGNFWHYDTDGKTVVVW